MDFIEFVNHMRQEVREEGFMSTVSLIARIVVRAKERNLIFDYEQVLNSIPCEDICKIQYANFLTVDYRVKDLYYYNPDSCKC